MKGYRRHIATGQFDNEQEWPNGFPPAEEGFEWVEGEPPENAVVYRAPSLKERVAAAFGGLDLALQIKFKDEIRDSAFFFSEGNIPMVVAVIAIAEGKLSLPDDQPVKDIIDLAKAALGVS